MAVPADVVDISYVPVVDVPIDVDMQVKSIDDVMVTFGDHRLAAIVDVDYDISYDVSNETVTITPLASLFTKMILAYETTTLHVRRATPVATDFLDTDAFIRDKIVDEIDRGVMRDQELVHDLGFAVQVPDDTTWHIPVLLPDPQADTVIAISHEAPFGLRAVANNAASNQVTPRGEIVPRLLFDALAGPDPSLMQMIDIEPYLRSYVTIAAGGTWIASGVRTALTTAIRDLYNLLSRGGGILECHGINFQIDQPLIFRNADLPMDISNSRYRAINNINLRRIDGAYTWQSLDFLLSIGSSAPSPNLLGLRLNSPRLDLNGAPIVGLHLQGYQHPKVRDLSCYGLVSGSIAILSTVLPRTRGKGMDVNGIETIGGVPVLTISKANPGVVAYSGSSILKNGDQFILIGGGMVELDGLCLTVGNRDTTAKTFELRDVGANGIDTTGYTDYVGGGIAVPFLQNHGCIIDEPNIIDGSGAATTSIGIETEDGDFNVWGGIITTTGEGFVSRCGGCNVRGTHFSMGLDAGGFYKKAIRIDRPRLVKLESLELDNSYIYVSAPIDNMYKPGISSAIWSDVAIGGTIYSGSSSPPASRGLMTFEAVMPGTLFRGLVIDADWLHSGVSSTPAVAFPAIGTAWWNGTGSKNIIFNPPDSSSIQPGAFPPGVLLQLARAGLTDPNFALLFNPRTGALMFSNSLSGDYNQPFIASNINQLKFGRRNFAPLSAISKTNPAVVTYTGTDIFNNGDTVVITESDMAEVNGKVFTVANLNIGAKTFELTGIDATGYVAVGTTGKAIVEQIYWQINASGALRPAFANTVDLGTSAIAIRDIFMAGILKTAAAAKIIGQPKTGWGVPTATLLRAILAEYTAATISNPPTQAEVQAIANQLQITTRTLAALINDLHVGGAASTHGVIST